MHSRIETLPEKKLIGKRMVMSFSNNLTRDLWRGFMPRRKEIQNNIGTDLYSVQIYPPMFFRNFNPKTEFEKWAAIEVTDFGTIPTEMESFILVGGLYVVFDYKGAASAAGSSYQYIHTEWLPNSSYELDARPHFDILGEKYKNDDPESEEELWIPIKPKAE